MLSLVAAGPDLVAAPPADLRTRHAGLLAAGANAIAPDGKLVTPGASVVM
jgi:hypothetical protein